MSAALTVSLERPPLLPQSPRRRATLVGGGAVFVWATGPSLAAIGSHYGALPFVSGSLAAAFVTLFAARLLRGERVAPMLLVPLPALLLMTLGFFGHNALFVSALGHAGPAEVTVISYMWPLLMAVLLPLFGRRRLSARTLVGPALGFAGVAFIVAPHLAGGGGGGGAIIGYLLAGGAALCFAVYSAARQVVPGGTVDSAGTACGLAAILAALLHLLGGGVVQMPDATALLAMVLTGAGAMGVASLMWDHGVRSGEGRVLAAAAYLTPVVSTALLLALGLGTPSLTLLAGGALVLAGIGVSMAGSRAR